MQFTALVILPRLPGESFALCSGFSPTLGFDSLAGLQLSPLSVAYIEEGLNPRGSIAV
jgi:hypothetical protein